jgi:hypothetical protein
VSREEVESAPTLGPILDAETLGGGDVPDRADNAPRPWINPDLLTDNWQEDELEEIPSIDQYLEELEETPPDLWDETPVSVDDDEDTTGAQDALPQLEVPASVKEQIGEQDEQPQTIALGSQGMFQGPTTLSLMSSNLSQELDELDDVFSAMGNIQPGQAAFIRVCFRTDPDFSAQAAAYSRALKYGQDPAPPKKTPAQRAFGLFSGIVGYLAHYLTRGGKYERPKPGSGNVDLTPVRSIDQTPELKGMIRDIENKAVSRAHYDVVLYAGVVGKAGQEGDMEAVLRDMHAGFENYATPFQRLQFQPVEGWWAVSGYMDPERYGDLVLSADELGELARIPDDITSPSGIRIKRSLVKPMLPRVMFPVDDPLQPQGGIIPLCIIGKDSEDERTIGIRNEELNQHMLVVGRTGTGKSVLMQWLMYGVAKANYPIVFMDPHGDSAEEVLDMLVAYCPERLDDYLFIDFGDKEWPVQLNPLDISDPDQLEETVHSIMEMLSFQMKLDGTGAPRAVNYAQQAVTALCEANLHLTNPSLKCTLLQVTTFFTDDKFRQLVVGLCSNPSIQEAYDHENGPFEGLSDRQKLEHAMPILRAFQPLGNSPSFANVFASPTNRLDFAQLINDRKVILLKLSKHGSQKALASFVGSLIIPYMLQSKDAWGRVRNPKTGKREGMGVRLFVDEAHSVIGDAGSSVMTVLAESRKWDFGLIAATQYPQQLDRAVEQAFYANTASKISLSLAQSALSGIAGEIDGGEGRIDRKDITRLPPYWGYMNILLGDPRGSSSRKQPSGPFSGLFLAPIADLMAAQGKVNPQNTPEHEEAIRLVKSKSRALVCQSADDVLKLRQGYTKRLKGGLGQVIADKLQADPDLVDEDVAWEGGWEATETTSSAPENDDDTHFPWE